MALERGLVEPPGEGMGPRRAWSRRQSWVNPFPVTGDLEVLTVQARAPDPILPRGVTHYSDYDSAHRFSTEQRRRDACQQVVPRHKGGPALKAQNAIKVQMRTTQVTHANMLHLEANELRTKMLLGFYTPLLGA